MRNLMMQNKLQTGTQFIFSNRRPHGASGHVAPRVTRGLSLSEATSRRSAAEVERTFEIDFNFTGRCAVPKIAKQGSSDPRSST